MSLGLGFILGPLVRSPKLTWRAPKILHCAHGVSISQNSLCFQPQPLNKSNNPGTVCQFGTNLGSKRCCW